MKRILAVILMLFWCGNAVLAQQQPAEGALQVQGMSALLDSVRRIDLQLQQMSEVLWEYRFLQRNRLQSVDQQLTELGQQGWELVAVTVEEGFILKRQRR